MSDVVPSKQESLGPLFARLREDGGRYLLSVALTREERDAQPEPTYGGKGHVRWLTDEEYAALCSIGSQATMANERVYPWRISADESPPYGVPVLCAWKRGDKWDYRVAKFTGKHWLDVIPETANERYLAPGYWQTLTPPVPAAAPESRGG